MKPNKYFEYSTSNVQHSTIVAVVAEAAKAFGKISSKQESTETLASSATHSARNDGVVFQVMMGRKNR